MDAPRVPMLVTIFLFLLFLQNFPSQIKADSPSQLVIDVCNRTINATFCVETLESNPRSSKASDTLTVAEIAIRLTLKHVEKSKKNMENMLRSKKTKDEYKAAIKQCSFWYKAMVNSYSSASIELKDDPMTANYDVAITKDDIDICKKFMVQYGANIESIDARNQIAEYYTSITTVVTNMLDA